MQKQLDNITGANNQLKEQLDNITQANNDLQEQLANTTDDLTKANNDLKDQNNDMQKQLDNITQANKVLQDQNRVLNDKLDAILKELAESKSVDVVLTVSDVVDVKFGQNVSVSGKLSDVGGNVLAGSVVVVSVGGSDRNVVTDGDGVYTVVLRASSVGDNDVVVSFAGTSKYDAVSVSTSFKVIKQDLKLSLDKIGSVVYGDNVVISGVLSDANGKFIPNTLLNINLNGKVLSVKTVSGGRFTFTTKASVVGTNKVTVSYKGNSNYNSVSKSASFKVTKQSLKITITKISNVRYKDTIKVTGKLSDANGKLIRNTLMNITINGKAYTAKTNSNGVYTLTVKATSIGSNKVVVSYKGNKNYNKASASTPFKVSKQDIKVSLSSSKYNKGNVTVTGKVTDGNGKVLMNTNVKVIINNKTYTAKSNNKGVYTLTKPVSTKKITLTLAYPGNKYYNAYSKTSKITLA